MGKPFGQVLSVLGVTMVMAVGGMASAASPVAMTHSAPVAGVVVPQQASGRPSLPVATLSVAAPGTSRHRSYWFASEPVPASGHQTRSYALLLSSLGMLGMIAWQRLPRAF